MIASSLAGLEEEATIFCSECCAYLYIHEFGNLHPYPTNHTLFIVSHTRLILIKLDKQSVGREYGYWKSQSRLNICVFDQYKIKIVRT